MPEADRERFDDLVAVARVAYGFNDDNTLVLFSMPLGLVRRAVLEVGRRLAARGRVDDAADAFEATGAELPRVLAGAGPEADVLAPVGPSGRRPIGSRHRSWSASPSPSESPSDSPTPLGGSARCTTPGGAAGGSASEPAARPRPWARRSCAAGPSSRCDPVDALLRIEPGDVLVTDTTTPPTTWCSRCSAAVAVEQGGAMSHAAILARELGLTAVIGVPGLLDRVQDGDQVEVDPIAGTITVVAPAT